MHVLAANQAGVIAKSGKKDLQGYQPLLAVDYIQALECVAGNFVAIKYDRPQKMGSIGAIGICEIGFRLPFNVLPKGCHCSSRFQTYARW